jgi:hypothetical protein
MNTCHILHTPNWVYSYSIIDSHTSETSAARRCVTLSLNDHDITVLYGMILLIFVSIRKDNNQELGDITNSIGIRNYKSTNEFCI